MGIKKRANSFFLVWWHLAVFIDHYTHFIPNCKAPAYLYDTLQYTACMYKALQADPIKGSRIKLMLSLGCFSGNHIGSAISQSIVTF